MDKGKRKKTLNFKPFKFIVHKEESKKVFGLWLISKLFKFIVHERAHNLIVKGALLFQNFSSL